MASGLRPRKFFFFFFIKNYHHSILLEKKVNRIQAPVTLYTLQNVMMQHYDATVDMCGCGKSQVS